MSLVEYEETRNFAAMIAEVVSERRMPPWHADRGVGRFRNERGLSRAEIDTLQAWVDANTPRGDPALMPPAPEPKDTWQIGEPDLIIEMPEAVQVPAVGPLSYTYVQTPTHFEEDLWVQAAEVRPGNPKVMHHMIACISEESNPGAGSPAKMPVVSGLVARYLPGGSPMIMPEGSAIRIPRGAVLLWQIHYTPTGKAESDRSRIGIVLADAVPGGQLHFGVARTEHLLIPPHEAMHRVEAQFTFAVPGVLYSFTPHMHLRGRSVQYEARFPDGRRELLLYVPQYDYNWQTTYELAEPMRIPKGTVIQCVAHFDNSEQNPANPDPGKYVRWGERTEDEMMDGGMDIVFPNPIQEGRKVPNPARAGARPGPRGTGLSGGQIVLRDGTILDAYSTEGARGE